MRSSKARFGRDVRRRTILTLAVALGIVGLTSALPDEGAPESVVFFPDDPLWVDSDREAIEKPRPQDPSDLIGAVSHSLFRPSDWEGPQGGYAWNINTLGEVPDSSWFTNRHGRNRMTVAELRTGPDSMGPPAPGPWRIVGEVGEGVTEKFRIRDRMEREYIVKLESPEFPELMSSAELICTKFLYSIGYNVPENYLVRFRPGDLVFEEASGMGSDLRELFQAFPHTSDGRIRAVASLLLPGEPLGPFSYAGVREDDPNDLFPHEHRRELRALRVFSAWLNHTDVKAGNSLDTYVDSDDAGYVRHHLIDFGSCLGSSGKGAKSPLTGHEYYLEPTKLGLGALTFGLRPRPYLAIRFPDFSAVGHLEADYYQPWRWKPPVPNPAFRLMDAADAFWAARIVARFTEEDIRALVSTAEISDPHAESHLVDLLLQRQKKTVAYWLTRTNPLDSFAIRRDESGALMLSFENAAIREGITEPNATYRYRLLQLDNESGGLWKATPERSTDGFAERGAVPVARDAFGPPDRFGFRYARVEIETGHSEYPHWQRPVMVTLRHRGSTFEVCGLRRPREIPPLEADENRSSNSRKRDLARR